MAASILRVVAALAAGLLLGSVLPAELLARSRGVDIRAVGDGNPGTINAIRNLGLAAGLAVGVYDIAVGVVAIQIALLLGVSEGVAYLAGIMTIVGHRFPVFHRFRCGGQGMGASTGMLLYAIAIALAHGWLSSAEIVVLLALVLGAIALTRSDRYGSLVMLPVLVVMLALGGAEEPFLAFVTAIAGYMWAVQLAAARQAMRESPAQLPRGQTRH